MYLSPSPSPFSVLPLSLSLQRVAEAVQSVQMNPTPPPVPSPASAWLEQQQQLQYADVNGFELSSRMMMSGITVLFFLLLFVVFYVYTRLFLHGSRFSPSDSLSDYRRHHDHRLNRRASYFVFTFSGPDRPTYSTEPAAKGLDPAVLSSLPSFVLSSLIHQNVLECTICLCEFKEGEKGRALGGCGHCFHIDCIDLWFQTHSTCPICRWEVKFQQSVASSPGDAEPHRPVPFGAAVELTASGEEPSVGVCHEREAGPIETPETAKNSSPLPPLPPESRFVGLRRILSRERWVGSSSDFVSNEVDLEVGGCEPQGQDEKR